MGKVALITGGAIRVGKALAEECATMGYRLVIHYHSSDSAAQQFAKELAAKGIEHHLICCDLSKPDQTKQLFSKIPAEFLPIELLINSAAIFPEHDHFESLDLLWENVMNINARSPISLIKQLYSQSTVTNCHVVNIIDARLNRTQDDHLVYRWSKSLLQQATCDLALTLAPKTRVNAIALGAILPPPGKGQDHLERLQKNIPLNRTGDLKHVQNALRYLVEQPFVTGEIMHLDGGEFL